VFCLSFHNFILKTVKDDIVRIFCHDLVTSTFRAAIEAKECNMPTQIHEHTARLLLDVGAGMGSKNPRGLCLLRLGSHGLVLEKHVVLECNSTKTREDRS
jgi:hypothetical protein